MNWILCLVIAFSFITLVSPIDACPTCKPVDCLPSFNCLPNGNWTLENASSEVIGLLAAPTHLSLFNATLDMTASSLNSDSLQLNNSTILLTSVKSTVTSPTIIDYSILAMYSSSLRWQSVYFRDSWLVTDMRSSISATSLITRRLAVLAKFSYYHLRSIPSVTDYTIITSSEVDTDGVFHLATTLPENSCETIQSSLNATSTGLTLRININSDNCPYSTATPLTHRQLFLAADDRCFEHRSCDSCVNSGCVWCSDVMACCSGKGGDRPEFCPNSWMLECSRDLARDTDTETALIVIPLFAAAIIATLVFILFVRRRSARDHEKAAISHDLGASSVPEMTVVGNDHLEVSGTLRSVAAHLLKKDPHAAPTTPVRHVDSGSAGGDASLLTVVLPQEIPRGSWTIPAGKLAQLVAQDTKIASNIEVYGTLLLSAKLEVGGDLTVHDHGEVYKLEGASIIVHGKKVYSKLPDSNYCGTIQQLPGQFHVSQVYVAISSASSNQPSREVNHVSVMIHDTNKATPNVSKSSTIASPLSSDGNRKSNPSNDQYRTPRAPHSKVKPKPKSENSDIRSSEEADALSSLEEKWMSDSDTLEDLIAQVLGTDDYS